MTKMRRKQNTVNMDGNGNFLYEDLIDVHDASMARRLQRRWEASNTLKKQNLSVNPVKRTLDDVQNGEEFVDPSYATYLNADVYSEDHSAGDDDDNDPEYVMCLKHLREDAKSYVLEMAMNDVMCMLVKYEEDNDLDDDLKRKSSKSVKDVSSGDKVGMERVWRKITREEKKEAPTILGSASNKGRKISVVEKDMKAECRANGRLSQKRDLVVCYKSDMGNENYECYLNCLKKVGVTMVLVTEDGKYIRYEEDYGCLSDFDSVIMLTGNVPFCDKETPRTPLVTSKTLLCKGSSSRTSSKFREKLMDILTEPFDKKEYKELLVEASHRKPIKGHRRLRSVEKTYPSTKLNKSYLDIYTDLANKIYSSHINHHRVLNLLRGFFYWLQNLSQEGAFPPWLDESCLKLM